MESATGVTAADIQAMIAGIPALSGVLATTGVAIISAGVIEQNILAAEAAVGTALGVLLGVHTVHCQQGSAPEDYPQGVIYKPAIQKPRNWFEGDRWGGIALPLLPVRSVSEIRVYPSGWLNANFLVPLERVRVSRKGFQIASAALMVGGLNGWLWSGQAVGAQQPLAMMMLTDGRAMPGGIEVTYEAGLSKREMDDYPLLATLVKLQALMLTLTFFQAFIGGGAQKEAAGMDGMTNSVELKKDLLGPLGGELRALTASYNNLLNIARMQYGATLITAWTG